MVVNVLVWLALFALAVLFGWLVTRAWRARRWFIRWPGVLLSGLLTLLMVAVLGLGAVGMYRMYTPTGSPAPDKQVELTPERIARGEHIADTFCIGCHSTNGQLPLTGGLDLANDIPIPIGSFVSSNLTPTGRIKDMTDGEIWRVLRQGIGADGRPLFVMSGIYSRYLSDEDLNSVIAYLRSQPPTGENIANPDKINYLGLLLVGSGMLPELPPVTEPVTAPPKDGTAEYGQYILSYQDCRSCHGADLNGGDGQLGPAGPGLRVVRRMEADQFINMMRTGSTPEGRPLQPPMPWQAIGRMDDTELTALYQYLVSLP